MSNPTWDLLLSCARVKYLSKTSIQIPFLLVFNSSLALISISLESDQLSSILKTTINANPAVSSNVGSKIVWSKSAAIKKSSAMRRPLNILATILRTYTCRRSFLILERSSWTKLANVIITIAAYNDCNNYFDNDDYVFDNYVKNLRASHQALGLTL